MMAKLLLDLAAAGDRIRPSPPVDERTPACPLERLGEVMNRGFDAMDTVMGHFR